MIKPYQEIYSLYFYSNTQSRDVQFPGLEISLLWFLLIFPLSNSNLYPNLSVSEHLVVWLYLSKGEIDLNLVGFLSP